MRFFHLDRKTVRRSGGRPVRDIFGRFGQRAEIRQGFSCNLDDFRGPVSDFPFLLEALQIVVHQNALAKIVFPGMTTESAFGFENKGAPAHANGEQDAIDALEGERILRQPGLFPPEQLVRIVVIEISDFLFAGGRLVPAVADPSVRPDHKAVGVFREADQVPARGQAEARRECPPGPHSPKVRAIGEIGLDFYRTPDTAETQLAALQAQLEIASRLQLPVVLHSRQALDAMLPLLDAWASQVPLPLQGRCGVLHAFAGDLPAAARAARAGFFLGAGGPVTYPSADALRATLAQVGLDRLLIETDLPYLPPQAHRGQRNEPAYVGYVAAALGQLTEMPPESVTEILRANAARLFAWDHGNHDARLC